MDLAPSTDSGTTPRHPIAVVTYRTGLSQHLLRVWERRYGAVHPARGEGGHRLYSDADVARLRLLHTVTGAGRSIGQVAELTTEALARLAAEDEAARPAAPRGAGEPAAAAQGVVADAMTRALALDAPGLDNVLRRAAVRLGVIGFIEQVATPTLRQVGEEWHAGRLTAAQEHLTSSTIRDILVETMRSLTRGNGAAKIVVATPAGDRYAIGAAAAGAAAAAEGWGVTYLGPELPSGDIARAAIATGARAVAMGVVYVDDRARMLDELRALRTALPPSIQLLVGGAGASDLADELVGSGIRVHPGLTTFRDALGDAFRTDAQG
jgi:DNA-binding transcriptional MerR regulator/methylmalonyl-CoA mutase cobalamin-binding subunit